MAMTPNPTGLYIKEVTLPTGSVYEIVDEGARTEINSLSTTVNNMSNYSAFLGVVSNSAAWTKIEDGSTTSTILVGSTTMAAATGNIVIYKPSNSTSAAQEFIWDGEKWSFFGDIGAKDLGSLAYKSSASGSYYRWKSNTITSATVTASGSITPAGTVSLSSATSYVQVSHTSTAPTSNCSNYWIYKPAGTVTVTIGNKATTAGVTGITGRTMITSVTYAAPTTSAPTGGLNYTDVSDHNLKLRYLVTASANSISGTTTASMTTSVTATSATFSGTTIYALRMGVSVPTSASFTASAQTVTVNSGTSKFVTGVTTTTESATVTVS